MKNITLRNILDNGEIIKEENIEIKDKDIVILKTPTREDGSSLFNKEHLNRIYDVVKECLNSKENNPLMILPNSVGIQILSIR